MSDSESDHLLRIGDFSRFTTLSVRMLRHYDQVGLLVPVHVDPSSGYRFYGPNQVRTASRIRTLRDAGCGIGQIAELLPLFDRTEELRVALRALKRRRRGQDEDVLELCCGSNDPILEISAQPVQFVNDEHLVLRGVDVSERQERLPIWPPFPQLLLPGEPDVLSLPGVARLERRGMRTRH